MTDTASEGWRGILDVALDCLRERQYERAWALYDELDRIHPSWIFEIKRAPLRGDGPREDTPARQVIAWMWFNEGRTLGEIGEALGCSVARAAELRAGGARRVARQLVAHQLGALEEDFEPESARRLLRQMKASRPDLVDQIERVQATAALADVGSRFVRSLLPDQDANVADAIGRAAGITLAALIQSK